MAIEENKMSSAQTLLNALAVSVRALGERPTIRPVLFSAKSQDERDGERARISAWEEGVRQTVIDGLRRLHSLATNGDVVAMGFLHEWAGVSPRFGDEPEDVRFEAPTWEDISAKVAQSDPSDLAVMFGCERI
jgi:hypothetical protein